MKLGILGGTFDPIHQGHLLLAQAAQTQFHLDKVLFVPALIPPHKTAHRDMTPAPYRYKMVEIAVQDHPGFEVCDIEFNRPDVSYTADTLRVLKEKYPGSQLFLIMGADSVSGFSQWKEVADIKKMAVILAAPRPKAYREAFSDFEAHWLDMQPCGISATEIRSCLAAGKKLEPGLVPKEVETYIEKMNLYQKKETQS